MSQSLFLFFFSMSIGNLYNIVQIISILHQGLIHYMFFVSISLFFFKKVPVCVVFIMLYNRLDEYPL